ncbi:o-succinylbenzoate--CoA ligase, partial [Dietzia sp. SYD-A1]|uniref:o-succinylbenzoate--CoA ligase n=1 Tax=Dietzia sp. SYD-A1 TaxID=2780141 RepID=UPI001891AE37
MPATRELRVLPVPGGPAVAELFPEFEQLLDDRGPALLPVPSDDPVRTRLLSGAMRPGDPVDDRTALVVSTSGSTGTPKGAMLSAAALAASASATDAFLGGPGRWLLALPAHHIAGLQVILRSLRAGLEPVVMDVTEGFDPASLPDAVAACRVGVNTGAPGRGAPPRAYTSLVPGQLAKVLDDGPPEAVTALASLDAVLLGGAAAAPELLARAAAAGIRVVRTYGMSETAGGCVYDGEPLPGVTVEIEDDDSGRVWLSGPQLALGYRNAPAHPAFARAGWFRTDDAGRVGEDGRLRILGRLDEALSVGGLTLLPQAVEDSLRQHAAVVDVVVVGIPDARLGTRPVAAVTLRTAATPDELRSHV